MASETMLLLVFLLFYFVFLQITIQVTILAGCVEVITNGVERLRRQGGRGDLNALT